MGFPRVSHCLSPAGILAKLAHFDEGRRLTTHSTLTALGSASINLVAHADVAYHQGTNYRDQATEELKRQKGGGSKAVIFTRAADD